MGSGPSPVIHVGFPKTGTTTLQRQVFPAMGGVTLITRRTSRGPDGYACLADELCREQGRPTLALDLATQVNRSRPPPPGVLVISDEILTGKGTDGRRPAALRLKDAIPDARILITVRSQATMLPSLHAQHVRGKGGTESLARFLAGKASGLRFDYEYARFDTVVDLYQALFGPTSVKVLPFEFLRDDPDVFIRTVSEFVTGEPSRNVVAPSRENASLAPVSLTLLRASNRVFRTSRFNPSPVLASRRAAGLTRRAIERLDRPVLSRFPSHGNVADREALELACDWYREPNRRLEVLTGLKLEPLGYPLP